MTAKVAGCIMAFVLPLLAEANKKAAEGVAFVSQFFEFEGERWQSHWSAERRQPYFVQIRTGHSQWGDPRRQEAGGSDTLMTFILFILPFVLMALAGGGYLLFIKMKHPDVLRVPKKLGRGRGMFKIEHSLSRPKKGAKASSDNTSDDDAKKTK